MSFSFLLPVRVVASSGGLQELPHRSGPERKPWRPARREVAGPPCLQHFKPATFELCLSSSPRCGHHPGPQTLILSHRSPAQMVCCPHKGKSKSEFLIVTFSVIFKVSDSVRQIHFQRSQRALLPGRVAGEDCAASVSIYSCALHAAFLTDAESDVG